MLVLKKGCLCVGVVVGLFVCWFCSWVVCVLVLLLGCLCVGVVVGLFVCGCCCCCWVVCMGFFGGVGADIVQSVISESLM